MPEALLAEGFRRAVLAFLVKERAIADKLRVKMLGWRHGGGFSAHNRVRIGDREGRMKHAGYMIRAPTSLEKMIYDDRRKSPGDQASGTVIYRWKMHLGLKRSFQIMPGAQWLELLVAVGTGVTPCPPHRSLRAALPHKAPTSGDWRESVRPDRDEYYGPTGCSVSAAC